MDKHLIFYTRAYNAEPTIGRAIDSLINQTQGNFIYYCYDNGSTDKTGQIIRDFASRDQRIVPLHTPKNWRPDNGGGKIWRKQQAQILSRFPDGYISFLDADDEYAPDFLEKMLAFTLDNNLDMAICGTEYVQTDGYSRLDTPPTTRILVSEEKALHLPEYYKYTTRCWAILYSLKLMPFIFHHTNIINKCDLKLVRKTTGYGATFFDVLRTLNAVRHSSRCGILANSLHKYYASPSQLSARYNPNWFWWVNVMQKHLRDFMLSYGPIIAENANFLNIRFLVWLKYILPRIQNADAPLETRLRDLVEIFNNGRTKTWLALDWKAVGILTDKREFLEEQLAWARLYQGSNEGECASLKELTDILTDIKWIE
jgi:glycosyltransferase involved in cell wall biosynthesis